MVFALKQLFPFNAKKKKTVATRKRPIPTYCGARVCARGARVGAFVRVFIYVRLIRVCVQGVSSTIVPYKVP